MSSFEFAQQCWEHYKRAAISPVISPGETMFNHWYDQVGQSTVRVILAAIAASQLDRVDKVMDLLCGHGRALRHLVAMFPGAQFTACDLDRAGVQFCAEEFGATPIVSEPDLAAVQFPDRYDIIWVGSLFTHVSKAQTAAWLAHLAGFLTDKGLIVATFHGRRSISLYDSFPFIAADSWERILRDYEAIGYGYADYTRAENHDFIAHSYGISVSRPETILGIAQAIPGVRVFSYVEAGWSDNQDVLVLGKPALGTGLPDLD